MTNWHWFLDNPLPSPKQSWRSIAQDKKAAKDAIAKDPNVLFRAVDSYNACMCGAGMCCFGECETEDATFLDLLLEYKTMKEKDFYDLGQSVNLDWLQLSKSVPLSSRTLQTYDVDWHYISYSERYVKTLDFCKLFQDKLVWDKVRELQIEPEEINEAISIIPFNVLLNNKVLSINDIQANLNKAALFSKELIMCYSIQEIETLEDENNKLRCALADHPDLFAKKCCAYKYVPKKYPEILTNAPNMTFEIIKHCPIDEQFVCKYLLHNLSSSCWYELSKGIVPLSDEFVIQHSLNMNFNLVAKWKQLDSNIYHKLPPQIICMYQKLTPEFIDENASTLDWFTMCEYQDLPEWLIKKYQDKVYWGQISMFQKLSPKFIAEFKGKLNEHKLSMNRHIKSCSN